ncbi:MAG: Tex-like N-terminal domain-containing protein [Patescibacteria group bacterium]
MQEPNYLQIIQNELTLRAPQITAVLDLVAEGATVPFIARYRKERTEDLDENQIRAIIDLHKQQENLYKAKLTALTGIEEQDALTPELRSNIELAKTLKEVEDIYAPYRLKKKTKAMLAIEKGFQIIADAIKLNRSFTIPESLLAENTREEVLEGAIEIIAAEISANAIMRESQRRHLMRSGVISSKVKSEKMLEKLNEKDRGEVKKFDIYADFDILISRIKPYQTLALGRGEKLGILTVKIEKDDECYDLVAHTFSRSTLIPELEEAIKK